MESQYLMDSNVVIDYLMGRLPTSGMEFMNPVIDNIPYASVNTKIEVLGFDSDAASLLLLEGFFEDAIVFDLSDEIVDKTIELRKVLKIKLPDAIIAATALVNQLHIITRNTSDFKNIPNLITLDAHLK